MQETILLSDQIDKDVSSALSSYIRHTQQKCLLYHVWSLSAGFIIQVTVQFQWVVQSVYVCIKYHCFSLCQVTKTKLSTTTKAFWKHPRALSHSLRRSATLKPQPVSAVTEHQFLWPPCFVSHGEQQLHDRSCTVSFETRPQAQAAMSNSAQQLWPYWKP